MGANVAQNNNNANANSEEGGGWGTLALLSLFVAVVVGLVWLYKYLKNKRNSQTPAQAQAQAPSPYTVPPGYIAPLINVPPPPSTTDRALDTTTDLLESVAIGIALDALLRGEIVQRLRSIIELLFAGPRFLARTTARIATRTYAKVSTKFISKNIGKFPTTTLARIGARFGKSGAAAGRATQAEIDAVTNVGSKLSNAAKDAAIRRGASTAGRATFASAVDIGGFVGLGLDLSDALGLADYKSTRNWIDDAKQVENSARTAANEAVSTTPGATPWPYFAGPLDGIEDDALNSAILANILGVLSNPPAGSIREIVTRLLTNLHNQTLAAPNQSLTSDDVFLVAGEGLNSLISEADFNTIYDYAFDQLCTSSQGVVVRGPGGFHSRCSWGTKDACLRATPNPLPTDDSEDVLITEWRYAPWFAQYDNITVPAGGACISYGNALKKECETSIETAKGTSTGDIYHRDLGVCENSALTCLVEGTEFKERAVQLEGYFGSSEWLNECHESVCAAGLQWVFGTSIARYICPPEEEEAVAAFDALFSGGSYCPGNPGGVCSGDALCAANPLYANSGRTKYFDFGNRQYGCCRPGQTGVSSGDRYYQCQDTCRADQIRNPSGYCTCLGTNKPVDFGDHCGTTAECPACTGGKIHKTAWSCVCECPDGQYESNGTCVSFGNCGAGQVPKPILGMPGSVGPSSAGDCVQACTPSAPIMNPDNNVCGTTCPSTKPYVGPIAVGTGAAYSGGTLLNYTQRLIPGTKTCYASGQCPQGTIQTETPTKECKASVNCEVSDWVDTTPCSATTCGVTGTKTQTRTVITQPAGNGTGCPNLTQTALCYKSGCAIVPSTNPCPYGLSPDGVNCNAHYPTDVEIASEDGSDLGKGLIGQLTAYCGKGRYGPSNNLCYMCPPNTYQPFSYNNINNINTCIPCPAGTSSESGSGSLASCH